MYCARQLRRHNVLYRSTIGFASGLGHRPHTIGICRIIAFIDQKTLIRLCARRSGARRFRRHNALYRSSIGAAIELVHRLRTIDVRRTLDIIDQTLICLLHSVPVPDGCVITMYSIVPHPAPPVDSFTVFK